MSDNGPSRIEDIPATRNKFTVEETARLLGIHPSTVRRRIKNGKLDAIIISDRVRWIPRNEIERLLTVQ